MAKLFYKIYWDMALGVGRNKFRHGFTVVDINGEKVSHCLNYLCLQPTPFRKANNLQNKHIRMAKKAGIERFEWV